MQIPSYGVNFSTSNLFFYIDAYWKIKAGLKGFRIVFVPENVMFSTTSSSLSFTPSTCIHE